MYRFTSDFRMLFDFFYTVTHYYKNALFRKADLLLLASYLFKSPYRISRDFLRKNGEKDVYAYGETPISSLDKLVKAFEITRQDTVIELGCGRGRMCFWLAAFVKCRVVGIDFVPQFIDKANAILKRVPFSNLYFLCEDFKQANLKDATVLYLHGSCMEDEEIESLITKLNHLKKGTRVISASFPLHDYKNGSAWKLEKEITLQMSWGETQFYCSQLL